MIYNSLILRHRAAEITGYIPCLMLKEQKSGEIKYVYFLLHTRRAPAIAPASQPAGGARLNSHVQPPAGVCGPRETAEKPHYLIQPLVKETETAAKKQQPGFIKPGQHIRKSSVQKPPRPEPASRLPE